MKQKPVVLVVSDGLPTSWAFLQELARILQDHSEVFLLSTHQDVMSFANTLVAGKPPRIDTVVYTSQNMLNKAKEATGLAKVIVLCDDLTHEPVEKVILLNKKTLDPGTLVKLATTSRTKKPATRTKKPASKIGQVCNHCNRPFADCGCDEAELR